MKEIKHELLTIFKLIGVEDLYETTKTKSPGSRNSF